MSKRFSRFGLPVFLSCCVLLGAAPIAGQDDEPAARARPSAPAVPPEAPAGEEVRASDADDEPADSSSAPAEKEVPDPGEPAVVPDKSGDAEASGESADPADADPESATGDEPMESKSKSAGSQPSAPSSSRKKPSPPSKPAASKPPADDDEPAESAAADADDDPTAAAERDAAESADAKNVEPAQFKEIRPGAATEDDLKSAWGKPIETKEVKGGVRYRYALAPFERVLATVRGGKVRSIAVRLKGPVPPGNLTRQLELDSIEPVTVFDAQDRPLGQAFPERGVLFSFAPQGDEPLVSEIVVEEIDPQAFALRAERRARLAPSKSLSDVNYALRHADQSGYAHWVKAVVLCEFGDWQRARKEVDLAIELEPDELRYRLTLVAVLLETADFASAARECQAVIDAPQVKPLHKALATCRLADALAGGPERNYAQAIVQHQAAIKLAEPLASSERGSDRREAKEILLDAHLGVAHDIACGRWQQKQRAVPKWLERAVDLADNLVTHEQADRALLLWAHGRAVATMAAFKNPPHPGDWITTAQTVGQPLVSEAADPARKRKLAWLLGTALADAAEIEYGQRAAGKALDYGKQAIHYLAAGEAYGHHGAARDDRVGRLYYRLGVIQAVDRQDHAQAVAWYKKATPLLESPAPPCAAVNPGRQGETFVSMAVSHWEAGGREEALRLTQQGARLMEQAAEEGLLERAALAVPYANLASMHEQLGNREQAQHFAQLAARFEKRQK